MVWVPDRVLRLISRPVAVGFIAGCLLLMVTGFISYRMFNVTSHDEFEETTTVAMSARNQLEIVLIEGLSATQTLALCIEQGVLPARFDSIAPKVLTSYRCIDAVELAPDGIVQQVYPAVPNQRAIGFNILTDSIQSHEAILAISHRSLVFAGPLKLVQNGIAVVGRRPVFLPRDGKDVFWGFSVVITKISTLLKAARLDELEQHGFEYRLSKKDPVSGTENVFVNGDLVLHDPVTEAVQVLDAEWILAVAPRGGWKAADKTMPVLLISGLLSLLGGFFAWYKARQPEMLTNLVEARTAELRESENRFRSLIEEAPLAIIMLRGTTIIYANPTMKEMIGLRSSESLVNTSFTELLSPESAGLVAEHLTLLPTHQTPSPSIGLVALRKDGTPVPILLNSRTVTLTDGPAELAFIADITERHRAEQEMQSSLQEKELLLKEIHHRVKNNLQVISSLLSMQARLVEDATARGTYMDSMRRIRSMAMVHEKLYRSKNLSQIDFGEYLRSIAEEVRHSIGKEGTLLRVDAEPVMLGVDAAVPCGLIANELISNAFKHAFADKQSGLVVASFRRLTDATLELKVEDDGIGFPAGADIFNMPSLGMSIVTSLTEQIQGTITLSRESGTRFTITFAG